MPTTYDNLHCKLFIDTSMDRDALIEALKIVLGGEHRFYTLYAPRCELDLSRNDEFRPEADFWLDDNFLFSRYYADVEPCGDVDQAVYIATVSTLLEALWAQGIDVVASCDFEDELPRMGGYNYENRLRQSHE